MLLVLISAYSSSGHELLPTFWLGVITAIPRHPGRADDARGRAAGEAGLRFFGILPEDTREQLYRVHRPMPNWDDNSWHRALVRPLCYRLAETRSTKQFGQHGVVHLLPEAPSKAAPPTGQVRTFPVRVQPSTPAGSSSAAVDLQGVLHQNKAHQFGGRNASPTTDTAAQRSTRQRARHFRLRCPAGCRYANRSAGRPAGRSGPRVR